MKVAGNGDGGQSGSTEASLQADFAQSPTDSFVREAGVAGSGPNQVNVPESLARTSQPAACAGASPLCLTATLVRPRISG